MTRAVPTTERLPAAVREGLARLAADAVGTFGPTPLSTLIIVHLSVFAELRQLGAAWAQIAELLAGLGIVGTNGPIAADVLRATYARAYAAAAARAAAKRNGAQRVEAKRSAAKPNDAGRLPVRADHDEIHPNATERNAGSGFVTQRNAADRNEPADGDAGSSLRKRAALLNRPTQTR
jgi:hypothetical protein